LVQVAVPSRTDVPEYMELIAAVNEIVGYINGKYSSFDSVPIHFLNKSVNFDSLVCLYACADACLVTSTRDGMNLVSYEFIASQRERHGVLILSEFAGAANCLNGAILVNPWDPEDIATAIHQALSMSIAEKESRHASLYQYVSHYTASNWGIKFVSELKRVATLESTRKSSPKLPLNLLSNIILTNKKNFLKTILMLELDGSLIETNPISSDASIPEGLCNVLEQLVNNDFIVLLISSGRTRQEMLDLFHCIPSAGLVAEHGAFIKYPEAIERCATSPPSCASLSLQMTSTVSLASSISSSYIPCKYSDQGGRITSWYQSNCLTEFESWKALILPVLNFYTARTPGTFIEYKEAGIAWHYRNGDPEFGDWQAAELRLNLEAILAHLPVKVI
jgi:trehalose 6-phosphate synthase/phosphatase